MARWQMARRQAARGALAFALTGALTGALWATLLALPTGAQAQDREQTLADIRQELNVLYVEIQDLKRELVTTGAPTVPANTGPLLDRIDAIEGALRQLTARTEELEHRIDLIVRDATNRIGDLEFRLVELEGGDVSKLGQTTTLGGPAPGAPAGPTGGGTAPDATQGSELAVAERADFEAAKKALEEGRYAQAAEAFARFAETYPGSPLTAEAYFLRGEALEGAGATADSARAYLAAFSAAPDGPRAPEALFRLGRALGALGQHKEACVTLAEVGRRFGASPAASEAEAEMRTLGCH